MGNDNWLNLDLIARVEVTSEDNDFPVEFALAPPVNHSGRGWRAAESGEQIVRLIFDEPQHLRRIRMHFVEDSESRTQEFALRWSRDGTSFHDIVRQQWNFTPTGATEEVETYAVDLSAVLVLELTIIPDISGGDSRASLARLQLA